jgi:heme exporter protein D
VSEARPARFPWWAYGLFLAVIALFAFAPVLSVLAATFIADSNGCYVNEGGINPCMIGGADWGQTLYTLFVLGWFMLATIPLGGAAFFVWLATLIIHRIAWGQMQKGKRS